jgi:hypothetical protein
MTQLYYLKTLKLQHTQTQNENMNHKAANPKKLSEHTNNKEK